MNFKKINVNIATNNLNQITSLIIELNSVSEMQLCSVKLKLMADKLITTIPLWGLYCS